MKKKGNTFKTKIRPSHTCVSEQQRYLSVVQIKYSDRGRIYMLIRVCWRILSLRIKIGRYWMGQGDFFVFYIPIFLLTYLCNSLFFISWIGIKQLKWRIYKRKIETFLFLFLTSFFGNICLLSVKWQLSFEVKEPSVGRFCSSFAVSNYL